MPSTITIEDSQILDGDALRGKLEAVLPNTKQKVIFISAYITQRSVDWFCKHTPQKSDKQIICRLLPSDVLFGSTHFSALKTALLDEDILCNMQSCVDLKETKIFFDK